jgi:hypothetical protein
MSHPDLTPEQQAESDRILAALRQARQADLRALADLLATEAAYRRSSGGPSRNWDSAPAFRARGVGADGFPSYPRSA